MVTGFVLGGVAGAVYVTASPAPAIVPIVALPLTTPPTLHVTAVFAAPVTVAVMGKVWFTGRLHCAWLIATLIDGGSLVALAVATTACLFVPPFAPPHPQKMMVTATRSNPRRI